MLQDYLVIFSGNVGTELIATHLMLWPFPSHDNSVRLLLTIRRPDQIKLGPVTLYCTVLNIKLQIIRMRYYTKAEMRIPSQTIMLGWGQRAW